MLRKVAGPLMVASLVMSTAAGACDLARDARDDGRIDAPDGTVIAWRVEASGAAPNKSSADRMSRGIPLDREFSLSIRACGKSPISSVSVDAQMPEHRHGMNYKPSITRAGDAWRADGLLLHMPGKWELIFAVATAHGVQRYTHALNVR